jgi:hypothetical protein
MVFLFVAVACVVAFRVSGASALLSSSVFVPLFVSGLGFAQAKEQTCVALAAIKQKNLDQGSEPMEDPAELESIRAQSGKVILYAALAAATLTALTLLVP